MESPGHTDPNCSAACWGVEGPDWKELLPELPEDMIALLASPVVVSAESFAGALPVRRPARHRARV